MTHTIRWWTRLGAVVILAAACAGGDAPGTPLAQLTGGDSAAQAGAPIPALGSDGRAALDSGNALFRSKQYAAALARYRAAAAFEPRHPAPLFGIYMVAQATSNARLTDSALVEMRARTVTPPPSPHALTDSAFKAIHPKGARAGPSATLRQ